MIAATILHASDHIWSARSRFLPCRWMRIPLLIAQSRSWFTVCKDYISINNQPAQQGNAPDAFGAGDF